MSDWRSEARRLLPELSEEIEGSESPGMLWVEIALAFDVAYQNPRNDGLIARIYALSEWFLNQNNDEFVSIVVTHLFEDIPTIPAARAEMPVWFTYEEVRDSSGVFGYMIEAHEFVELVQYMKENQHCFRGRRYET